MLKVSIAFAIVGVLYFLSAWSSWGIGSAFVGELLVAPRRVGLALRWPMAGRALPYREWGCRMNPDLKRQHHRDRLSGEDFPELVGLGQDGPGELAKGSATWIDGANTSRSSSGPHEGFEGTPGPWGESAVRVHLVGEVGELLGRGECIVQVPILSTSPILWACRPV